jgi:heptosyltransferase-3
MNSRLRCVVMIGPSFSYLFGQMYGAVRKNWRTVRHFLRVCSGFSWNYARLRLRRVLPGGRPTVAIALIEHMGDIVAAEPVSRFAKKQFPGAELCWITSKSYKEVVMNFPFVDRIVTVRCLTEWMLLWASGVFDVTWDLHISERTCPKCAISFVKPEPAGLVTYQTYYNFGNLLTVNCLCAGIAPLDDGPVLKPDSSAVGRVDELGLPDRFVVVHCKSNESSRDWRPDKWDELVRWIANDVGLPVVEVGGRPYVIQRDDAKTRSLCGALTIMETAEVIRRAGLFVGIDSGPAHLANAVGTPGVILLGQYQSFRSYTPYSGSYADGSDADLVRADGFAETIAVDTVMTAVAGRVCESEAAALARLSNDSRARLVGN